MKTWHKVSAIVACVAVIVAYLAWEILSFASSTKFQARNYSLVSISDIRLQFDRDIGPNKSTSTQKIPDMAKGASFSQRLPQSDAYLTVFYKREGAEQELDCGYIGSTWDTYLVTFQKDGLTSKCELLAVGNGPGPT